MYGFFEKLYGYLRCFLSKIVRICTINKKIVRFVRFFVKMYGFVYGFFQKSFGHPEAYNIIRDC